jgi:iron complex outermembrane recepter protein
MTIHRTRVATAVALMLLGLNQGAQAQTTAQTTAPSAPAAAASASNSSAQTIEITGIRASIEKSLATKKASTALVEVVSAEKPG